jgi:hypothetical protein
MARSLNIRLIIGCVALIVFIASDLYAGIFQRWVFFGISVALTAISAGYAMVAAEWWRTSRGGDSARPGAR